MRPLGAPLRDAESEPADRTRDAPEAAQRRGGRREEGRYQVLVEREDRLAASRVALARAATEELPVDARRVVEFGGDDVQAARLGDAGPQLDVGAAPGHVGGDGEAARLAGARDDLGLV